MSECVNGTELMRDSWGEYCAAFPLPPLWIFTMVVLFGALLWWIEWSETDCK